MLCVRSNEFWSGMVRFMVRLMMLKLSPISRDWRMSDAHIESTLAIFGFRAGKVKYMLSSHIFFIPISKPFFQIINYPNFSESITFVPFFFLFNLLA